MCINFVSSEDLQKPAGTSNPNSHFVYTVA
jgi:hypothetical protein